jgi:hypothetical protein
VAALRQLEAGDYFERLLVEHDNAEPTALVAAG